MGRNSISDATSRLAEEKLYEYVALELERGERRSGLWAKALANSDGSDAKATGLYIKYRVQSLIDEATLIENFKKEQESEFHEEYLRKEAEELEHRMESDRKAEILTAERAKRILASKGYRVENKSNGWVVRTPEGGKQKISSANELYYFAESC